MHRPRWYFPAIPHRLFPEVCSLPDCRAPRSRLRALWKNQTGVECGGRWYCGPACFERAVAGQLEQLLAASAQPARPHRLPLGLLLLARGQLTPEQLAHALEAQRHAACGRIGEWLVELGFVGEDQLVAALGQQWGCPVLRLRPQGQLEWRKKIPRHLLETFRMYPVQFVTSTRTLYLALSEQVDHRLLYNLEQMLDCRIAVGLVSRRAMENLLSASEVGERASEIYFERTAQPVEIARICASYVARTNATQVRWARCGHQLWVQIECPTAPLHLLFGLSSRTFRAQVPEPFIKFRGVLPMSPVTAQPEAARRARVPAIPEQGSQSYEENSCSHRR